MPRFRFVSVLAAAISALLAGSAAQGRADPVRIYAAGSMTAAIKDLVTASGFPANAVAPPPP